MNKRFVSVLAAAFLLIASAFPAFADAFPDSRLQERLVDEAGLLDEEEKSLLLGKLDEISERQNMDVAVLTNYSVNDESPKLFAADYFENNGYGMGEEHDGILLMLTMETRDWAIVTHGYGIDVFTDAGQEYITDIIVDCFSDGEYYEGFDRFADLCDEFITAAAEGEPYDYDNLPEEEHGATDYVILIGTAIVAGALLALIVTLAMKSKLKSVRFQSSAKDYVRAGSMKLENSEDIFLYRNVSRVRKSNNSSKGGSSTFSGSSGSSFGGSSGKF